MPSLIADLQPSLFKVRSSQDSVPILQHVWLRMRTSLYHFLCLPCVCYPSSSSEYIICLGNLSPFMHMTLKLVFDNDCLNAGAVSVDKDACCCSLVLLSYT